MRVALVMLVAVLGLTACGGIGATATVATPPPSPTFLQANPGLATLTAVAASQGSAPTGTAPPLSLPTVSVQVQPTPAATNTAIVAINVVTPTRGATQPPTPNLMNTPAIPPTRTPTAAPFARFTAADVIMALLPQGGIEDVADGVRAPAGEPWPNVQRDWKVFGYGGVSAARRGGQVLTYGTPENLAAMQAYLDRLPADVKVYSYVKGNALLFLSNQVAAADAEKLRAAFLALP